jgi:hypothetical protein
MATGATAVYTCRADGLRCVFSLHASAGEASAVCDRLVAAGAWAGTCAAEATWWPGMVLARPSDVRVAK